VAVLPNPALERGFVFEGQGARQRLRQSRLEEPQRGDVLVSSCGVLPLGLGAALLLIFLEVGLSEERDLAREEERRRQRSADRQRGLRPRRWPRRPRLKLGAPRARLSVLLLAQCRAHR
jgi:hypothetical protein